MVGEGYPYFALLVDADSVPNLTPDLLQKWIDFCAMFLDLDNYESVGQAEKRALRHMAGRRSEVIAKHVPASPMKPKPKWQPTKRLMKYNDDACVMAKGLAVEIQ